MPDPQKVLATIRRATAGAIYDAYIATLSALPLAARTPNRVFLCLRALAR